MSLITEEKANHPQSMTPPTPHLSLLFLFLTCFCANIRCGYATTRSLYGKKIHSNFSYSDNNTTTENEGDCRQNKEKTAQRKKLRTRVAMDNIQLSYTAGLDKRLALASEDLGVLAEPVLCPRASGGLRVTMSLSDSARLLAGGGESTQLTVLVDGGADPVLFGVSADSLQEMGLSD